MMQVWRGSFGEVLTIANRRALGRPGHAWRPTALFPRMGCTRSYAGLCRRLSYAPAAQRRAEVRRTERLKLALHGAGLALSIPQSSTRCKSPRREAARRCAAAYGLDSTHGCWKRLPCALPMPLAAVSLKETLIHVAAKVWLEPNL